MLFIKSIALVLISITFLLCQTSSAEDTIKVLMLSDPHSPLPSEQAERVKDLSGKIFINEKFYEGDLRILRDINGLHVINKLPVEKYVTGAVASEIENDWEVEALKAQAIIARTYAMFYKKQNAGRDYYLTSSLLHKVYENKIDPLITYAAKATEGKILTYGNSPIKALHHATCYGKTELPEEVWKESYPYLKSVSCYGKNAPYESWQRTFGLEEISKAFGTDNVDNLEIISYTATGRVKTLRLTLATDRYQDTSIEVSAMELQRRLGQKEFPSTSFTLIINKKQIVFSGKGLGHGVGLSKWGALEMAQKGKNYQEILSHYYPGTVIQDNHEMHHQKFVYRK